VKGLLRDFGGKRWIRRSLTILSRLFAKKKETNIFCPFLNAQVAVPSERTEHIFEYHPDVKLFIHRLREVIQQPDEIRVSSTDPEVVLFYRFYYDIFRGKYLAVVLKRNDPKFLLTAYFTDTIKEGEQLWKKKA